MKVVPYKKLLERLAEGKLKVISSKQTRNGCKVELLCTETKIVMGDNGFITIEFYHGKDLLGSLEPFALAPGATATIKGLKSILEVRLT